MSILVTGGVGYIGSHVCVELIRAGYEIVVVDNLSNSHMKALEHVSLIVGKKIKFYPIDLIHYEELETVFLENQIEAVIHLAGLKAVGESVVVPLHYYRNNVIGTIVLCELMRKFEVKNMVFSSSATVYGFPESVPISEDFLPNPINPYGRTKYMTEEILRDLYLEDQEWSAVILRYFNPIGAHESGLIGENPNGIPNNLMPLIVNVAAGKQEVLHIYGNSYPTFDGTGVRDYLHVTDLAIAHVKALEKALTSYGVDVFNLGTGKGYSVLELVSTFEEVTEIHIPYEIVNPRPGDVAICYADPTKAKEKLGWEAVKGIEEMCIDVWRWQSNNPEGYSLDTYKNTNKIAGV